MKRLSLAAALLFGAAALLSANSSTSVVLSGSLSGTDGFVLNSTDQKDPDALEFTYEGKNVGGGFKLWTKAASDSVVKIRGANLWFKPLNTLKIGLGGVGVYTYVEQLDWWQVPTAASLDQFNGWDTRWSATVAFDADNAGLMVESTALPGLTLSAGVAPGYGNALYAAKESAWSQANLRYGAAAKYEIKGIGSVAAAYRDDGKDNQKIFRVGADTNAVPNVYTFVNLIGRVDNTAVSGASSTAAQSLAGLTVDTFAAYTLNAFKLQAHVPVTVRLTGAAGDPSYFCYDVKTSYALPAVKLTPYFRFQQDGVSLAALKVLPQFNLGTDIGGWDGGSLTVSLQYTLGETENNWSIPFQARIIF